MLRSYFVYIVGVLFVIYSCSDLDSTIESSSFVEHYNDSIRNSLPYENTQDYERAKKGFIASIEDSLILSENGEVVFNPHYALE